MMDDDLTLNLKQMSNDRHQIFKKLELIKKRMDALHLQISSNKNMSTEAIESELQSLEDEGYRLEIELNEIMINLKNVRANDRAPEAI